MSGAQQEDYLPTPTEWSDLFTNGMEERYDAQRIPGASVAGAPGINRRSTGRQTLENKLEESPAASMRNVLIFINSRAFFYAT
ncbi:hypothetical protein KIN20_005162 [Parelaphostrongylus tenuis]|uniref:Uncharacterized protein n=1 Tax=Parelaphostrongylus tenuis TaxID=148309 RepID=A0AAD5QJW1_PARTN|nr:hypothetical protein KIN20_005162 [Parelaphostrongylus tenuis]